MNKDSVILIVGHDDIIENSLYAFFKKRGYGNVHSVSRLGLNPSIQTSVYEFFQDRRPEYVFLGPARSGGIRANQENPAEFCYQNLESQNNIVYAARKFEAKKLLFYAASCIYPKDAGQPIKEESLLTGPLEETSEAYAVAKIAGVALCQAYRRQYGFNAISCVPPTVYGPASGLSEDSHVIGALMGKFLKAKEETRNKVVVWGSGEPRREFIYVDDFIDASLHLMKAYDDEALINIGTGTDISIRELAGVIAEETGFSGKIEFDTSQPDGAPRKQLDDSRIKKTGWKPKVPLREGVRKSLEKLSSPMTEKVP